MTRSTRVVLAAPAACAVALVLAVTVGSTTIDPGELGRALLAGPASATPVAQVVWQVRLPEAVTAALAGAGLAAAGVVMQTLFANPLAEPYVLGVSAGASLGVALVVAGTGTAIGTAGLVAGVAGLGALGLVVAAAAGAAAVLALVLAASRFTESTTTLLLVGVMIGAAVSAVVGLLLVSTDPRLAQQYLAWGLGSVSSTAWGDLAVLAPVVVVLVVAATFLARPLDALLLGADHAHTVGVAVRRLQWVCLLGASVLAGVITAYCGPIAFLGMAVPHLARLALGGPAHRALLPTATLCGAAVACLCAVLTHLPGTGFVVPFNVVTALVGAPVVATVLLRSTGPGVGEVGRG